MSKRIVSKLLLFVAALLLATATPAIAQPLHLWDFNSNNFLGDTGTGGLDLNFAPGEGDVGGTMGAASDVVFEPGYNGIGRAYRPFYVDASQSSTAGAGLAGSGFTSPSQFTIEALVRADQKTSGSAVNYIFQTRPGSDRGYYLVQDENNVPVGTTSGLGSIIGNNFGDAEIQAGYTDDEHWFFIAATIDLTSNTGMAEADIYVADVTAGETTATLVSSGRTWNTADPSALAGATGIFGIGNFALDRGGDGVAEASQEWFQGAIDYVAIYDGALSAGEINGHLDARLSLPEPSTTGLLTFAACGFGWVARRRRAG